MSTTVIEARGLTKHYSNGRGCHEINISVKEGEAFGFLGPNGAGKSTFVKMLAGLIYPSSGTAELFGHPIGTVAAHRMIGYLPELYRYQEWLTGEEVIRFHAKLCSLNGTIAEARIRKLLDDVGIGLRGKDRVKHYSKGMQQRLGLACALIADPPLLFLDEPSSAMDPMGRWEVRELLKQLKLNGKTIFLNSHLLEDVELLCDRIALLNDGTLLQEGAVSEVLLQKSRWHFRVSGFVPSLLDWLHEQTGLIFGIEEVKGIDERTPFSEGTVLLTCDVQSDEQVGWLNHLIIGQGMTLYEVKKAKGKLDEWFVGAIAGKNQRGERV